VLSQGQYGERDKHWAAHLMGIPARIQRKSATETVFADRETVQSNYSMYAQPTADIKPSDRIIRGDRTFEVNGVDDVNGAGIFLKIDLQEIV